MMKENVSRFLTMAQSDSELREKLEQIKQTYMKQLISLSQEVGTPLTAEDFFVEAAPIDDKEATDATGGIRELYLPLGFWIPMPNLASELEAVSGGYNPRSSPGSYEGYFD